jgi:hypothetical protein
MYTFQMQKLTCTILRFPSGSSRSLVPSFLEENRVSKLTAVVNYIEKNEKVGTVDKPKTFFRGKMALRWGPAVYHEGVVFFGGFTDKTAIALCGSLKHLLSGPPPRGNLAEQKNA